MITNDEVKEILRKASRKQIRYIESDGRYVKLYTVSILATVLGRTDRSVRMHVKAENFPRPTVTINDRSYFSEIYILNANQCMELGPDWIRWRLKFRETPDINIDMESEREKIYKLIEAMPAFNHLVRLRPEFPLSSD